MKPTDDELKVYKDNAAQWARARLDDAATVVLDLETTGILSKDPDTEIAQIALTDVKGRSLFCMLLKPNKPMSDEVMGIHGITNEQCSTSQCSTRLPSFCLLCWKRSTLWPITLTLTGSC